MLRTTLITVALAVALAAGAADHAAAGQTPQAGPVAPAESGPRRVPLTRIYRGDDGSVLYVRQLLTGAVFAFGEHPGLDRAYVLSGTVGGDRVDGSWWDVSKGKRGDRGTLALRWSQGGARIVRSGGADFGPDVFTAIDPSLVPWPNREAAGFQSTSTNDLDGLFVGDDGSNHYVRERAGTVVWVAEQDFQPGGRPGWVSVFVGTRKPNGGFAGTWADVPKGTERASGTFGAALIGTSRELRLTQTGIVRTKQLAPYYSLDWDRFVRGISDALDKKVAGYGIAISHRGAVVRTGAGGVRRHAIDGGALPFTPNTVSQTASAAKLVTAVAIVKALRDRGLTVDARVAPFLPSCLEQGPGIGTLTFRQLLDHTSGLSGARGFDSQQSCNGRDPFDCLVELLEKGRVWPRTRAYNNKAYDLFRFLVPLVNDTSGTANFELHDCKNTAGILHRKVAEAFVKYVRHEILLPVGSDSSWYPSGEFSLTYNCGSILLRRCSVSKPGERMTTEYFLRSASGKAAMSAVEYIRFLSAFDRGEILPKSVVQSMKAGLLGLDGATSGAAGPYARKTGGCPSLENRSWDRGCSTVAMMFPGDVQAYVTVNSTDNKHAGSLTAVVRNAFDAALRP
jgi:CubicO group peptidase (beta-lactamase class C family)